MKKTMIWLTMACALMSILACGSEEGWSEDEVAEAYTEADIFETDEKSLTKQVQQRYRCRCQLDASTCPNSHPFAVVKQNTCRYKGHRSLRGYAWSLRQPEWRNYRPKSWPADA